jgi:transposase InsO family protein
VPVAATVHEARSWLFNAHCGEHGSHDGRDRMEAFLRTRVYFENVQHYCAEVSAACPECQSTKSLPFSATVPLRPIVEAGPDHRVRARAVPACVLACTHRAHTQWTADFTTLPTDEETGNCQLCVIVDHFTGSTEAEGFPTQDTGPFLRWLEGLVDWHTVRAGEPVPRLLHTDNGGAFVSAELEAFCTRRGIKLVHGRPRHPQSQGKVENKNKTIKQKVRARSRT